MVDFDSDTRVFFADRQDNDEIIEDSYELQFGGTHGDREQFNWVIGYYANERSAKSRVPTFSRRTVRVRPAGQRRRSVA